VKDPKAHSHFESEREKTDLSLKTERAHVDKSLAHSRDKIESETDEALKRGRVESNEMMHAISSHEREKTERVVKQERSSADRAIQLEREIRRDLVETLLTEEREQTDASLKEERRRTDVEVENVTVRLSDEVAKHLKTSTALTTRDELLAIVSHDLRNPIGAVHSCADMLLEENFADETFENPDANLRHWIEFIKRNAETALRLINDILDLERIAEGKLRLHFGNFSFDELLKDATQSFVHLASAKNIFLQLKPNQKIGSVICDRDRLLQVLSNLIGNALKFTADGGMVEVAAQSSREGRIYVSVTDTGCGIPDDKVEEIFERFTQLGQNDRKGLGLGLYISKMLIEAHQGQISVKSKLQEGSEFWFEIPRQGPDLSTRYH